MYVYRGLAYFTSFVTYDYQCTCSCVLFSLLDYLKLITCLRLMYLGFVLFWLRYCPAILVVNYLTSCFPSSRSVLPFPGHMI